MTGTARFTFDDGRSSVLVEIGDGGGVTRAGRTEQTVTQAKETFEAAFEQVRIAASSALGQLTRLPNRPDEVELKFGVKLDAQAGAIIARTGAQAQFEVKLRWQRDPGPRREDEQVDEVTREPDPSPT